MKVHIIIGYFQVGHNPDDAMGVVLHYVNRLKELKQQGKESGDED